MDRLKAVQKASTLKRRGNLAYDEAVSDALDYHTAVEIADAAGVTRQAIYETAKKLGKKPVAPVRTRKPKPEPKPKPPLKARPDLAMNAVWKAVRDGKLVKGPCEVCGSTKQVEGHHEDYADRLNVRWLCNRHHREVHRALRNV